VTAPRGAPDLLEASPLRGGGGVLCRRSMILPAPVRSEPGGSCTMNQSPWQRMCVQACVSPDKPQPAFCSRAISLLSPSFAASQRWTDTWHTLTEPAMYALCTLEVSERLCGISCWDTPFVLTHASHAAARLPRSGSIMAAPLYPYQKASGLQPSITRVQVGSLFRSAVERAQAVEDGPEDAYGGTPRRPPGRLRGVLPLRRHVGQ
jgi:hypothetical protein